LIPYPAITTKIHRNSKLSIYISRYFSFIEKYERH